MASPTLPTREPPRRRDQFPATGPNSLPSMWLRAGARILDMFIVGIPTGLFTLQYVDLGARTVEKMMTDVPMWVLAVVSFLPFVYDSLSLAIAGRTIGKAVFGIKVVRYVDGQRVTVTQALLRSITTAFGSIVGLGIPLGGLMSLWTPVVYTSAFLNPLGRGFHDLAAGTIVVRY